MTHVFRRVNVKRKSTSSFRNYIHRQLFLLCQTLHKSIYEFYMLQIFFLSILVQLLEATSKSLNKNFVINTIWHSPTGKELMEFKMGGWECVSILTICFQFCLRIIWVDICVRNEISFSWQIGEEKLLLRDLTEVPFKQNQTNLFVQLNNNEKRRRNWSSKPENYDSVPTEIP